MEPRFRTIDGLSIRYAESEPRQVSALLLSPWPESLLAFDQLWSPLAENTHLVAIDLPGFGHSERSETLLSPRAMGDFLVRVADEFGLDRPHVVGPDVGTSASLFGAALYPGRFRSLVVGSGGAAVPLRLAGALDEWVRAPDLDAYRAVDPRRIVDAAIGSITGYSVPEDVREDYRTAYEGDRFVESMRYARRYPAELPVLGELLHGIRTPVRIIAGRDDRVVPLVNAEYLHERLPHSRLDVLDAGHFTWEEDAKGYGELVANWWAGGYATV